ncbi:hypothetical protein RND81_10G189500 [Saponaria officinalis]|uniref:Dirigent protein n=1 Tax=Saponaria officinalis TaxID=3572 RepID=A0AAW1I6C1_SAPOF
MSFKSIPSSIIITCSFLLLFSITRSSARILLDMTTPSSTFVPQTQPSLTFLMQDVLINTTRPSTTTTTTTTNLPFSTPFPTYPPIFTANSNNPSFATQTLDIPGFEISIPATSTLEEELQFGHTTTIESNMYVENEAYGPQLVGKAEGIYVAIDSEDVNGGHMMAMTASFISMGSHNNNKGDYSGSLRLFGVHTRDVYECQVAVIGGTGNFHDANGYATISAVNRRDDYGLFSDFGESSEEIKQLLLYIYLS